MKKRIIKHTIALILILFFTALIEILFFNSTAIFNDTYNNKYTSNKKQDFILEKSETEEFLIYSLDTEGKHINKLYMNYKSDKSFIYTISLIQNGESIENNSAYVSDTAYEIFDKAVTIIDKKADKVLVKINKADFEGSKEPNITSIHLSNQMQINAYRVVFIFITLFAVYMIFFMRRTVVEHLEYVFLVIALSMGTMIILLSPDKFMSWDEQIHFNRAYEITFSKNVEYTESTDRMYNMDFPLMNTIDERELTAKFLQDKNHEIIIVNEKPSDFVDYSKRSYLPQAFGLKLGRAMGLPLQQVLWLGKFFNLLVYSIIFAAAIKFSKLGKKALLCVGLLPTSLFLAATYSYDAFITAFLMLGLVMIINELIDKSSKLNWKHVTVGVLALVIGSFSKAVYVPFLLLFCFIPKEKFKSKRQRKFYVLTIILIFLIMMSSFILPALGNVVANIDTVGDSRGGDTSVTRQIMYILDKPFTYIKLLFDSMVSSIGQYFFGCRSRTLLAYMGNSTENIFFLSIVLTIFVTVTGADPKVQLSKKMKIVLSTLIICVAALIWTALYLDFTPVGSSTINGVQERYYIPLMYPLMLLFMSSKIKCEIDEFKYNKIVLLTNLVILFGSIYGLILLPYSS